MILAEIRSAKETIVQNNPLKHYEKSARSRLTAQEVLEASMSQYIAAMKKHAGRYLPTLDQSAISY